MLRGGRSGPSETKLGGGAETAGKRSAETTCDSSTIDVPLGIEVTEQNAAHRLHLSAWLEGSSG